MDLLNDYWLARVLVEEEEAEVDPNIPMEARQREVEAIYMNVIEQLISKEEL